MQAIKLQNVTFAYEEGVYAVNGISLEINQGEYIAIVGKNGSGKSTFLHKAINHLTKNYSKEKWITLENEMHDIFNSFSEYMKQEKELNSIETQNLVKTLQNHISENYYLCRNDILLGLLFAFVLTGCKSTYEDLKNNVKVGIASVTITGHSVVVFR